MPERVSRLGTPTHISSRRGLGIASILRGRANSEDTQSATNWIRTSDAPLFRRPLYQTELWWQVPESDWPLRLNLGTTPIGGSEPACSRRPWIVAQLSCIGTEAPAEGGLVRPLLQRGDDRPRGLAHQIS